MRRILQVAHQYLPDFVGGVELHCQALSQELAGRGYEVALFYRRPAPEGGLEGRQEGSVRLWGASAGPMSPTQRFLATFQQAALQQAFEQVLAEATPELVHIHHLMGLPTSLVTTLIERGIPYVITLHDYWWLCANAQLLTNDQQRLCAGPAWWLNCGRCALARAGLTGPGAQLLAPGVAPLLAYRHRQLQPLLQQARRLIAPTEFTRQLHLEQLAISPGQVQLIPHGIALPPAGPQPGPRPGLHLAYVGGLAPQKGVHILLAAMEALPSDVSLTLYGPQDAFPAYVAELQAATRHPGVHWAGALPNATLLAALRQADALVMPSLWYETAGLVIQEAFAVGVPVVASRLGAMAERVRHGVDGLLVEPGNPEALAATLRHLRDEPTLLHTLRAGIRPVRTIQTQVSEIAALYEQLLN